MESMRIEFQLAFATRKDVETGVYVGFCPVLDLYSQGTSEGEAEEAIVSAATLFIGSCYERDNLHSVLRQRGLKKVAKRADLKPGEAKQYILVEGYSRAIERSVPLELLSPMGEEALCR